MDRPGVAVRYMWQLNSSRCWPESILFTCLIKAAVPRLRMLSAGKCRPCLFQRLQGLNTSEAGNCAHSVYLVPIGFGHCRMCLPSARSYLRGCLETFGEGGWPGRGVIP